MNPIRGESWRDRKGWSSRESRTAGLIGILFVVACGGDVNGASIGAERGDIPYTPFETVHLSGRDVTVRFTGAALFDIENPCSANYELDVNLSDGVLQVGVWEQPHPQRTSDIGCPLIGYQREETRRLESEYRGAVVVDLAGHVRYLRAPASLPAVQPQPGWEAIKSMDIQRTPNGGWQTVYQHEGRSTVTLVHVPEGQALWEDDWVEGEPAFDQGRTFRSWETPHGAVAITWEEGGAANMLYAEPGTGLTIGELLDWAG